MTRTTTILMIILSLFCITSTARADEADDGGSKAPVVVSEDDAQDPLAVDRERAESARAPAKAEPARAENRGESGDISPSPGEKSNDGPAQRDTGNQRQEEVSGLSLMVAAFVAIWLLLFIFLLFQWRRVKSLQEQIDARKQARAKKEHPF